MVAEPEAPEHGEAQQVGVEVIVLVPQLGADVARPLGDLKREDEQRDRDREDAVAEGDDAGEVDPGFLAGKRDRARCRRIVPGLGHSRARYARRARFPPRAGAIPTARGACLYAPRRPMAPPDQLSKLAIVPAYNEAGMIGRVLREIRRHAPDFDVVVIDDG